MKPGEDTPLRMRPGRSGPDFVSELMIYQVWLRSFTREGTLRAAAERLSHVAGLGANMVHLSPVARHSEDTRPEFLSPRTRQSKAGHCRNPYRISDYGQIEPEYGTEQDLKEFVARAHELRLRVILDVVFYHTGPDSVLLREHDFFHRDSEGNPLLGDWNFPALNFESTRLRRYLIDNLLYWVREIGVDGFRCDVSFGVPLDFWEEARTALDEHRNDLVMLAESEVPEDQLRAFDLNYNFSYYDTLKAVIHDGLPATRLREYWELKHASFPSGAHHIYCSDNHDMDRVDVVFGSKGAAATAVLNFMLDGIPFVFNGQEIGDTTPDDVMSRVPIRWEAAWQSPGSERLELYRRLFSLRRNERALTRGNLVWLANDVPADVLSFVRQDGPDSLLVVINLSNRRHSIVVQADLKEGNPIDILLADCPPGFERRANGISMKLSSFGFVVAKLHGNPAPSTPLTVKQA